jgi:hypothetical protein
MESNTFPEIRIYPNPTNGELWIEGIGNMSEVEVINILGETVGSYLTKSKNLIKLDLSGFQAGIYQIKISGSDGVTQRKVVKK